MQKMQFKKHLLMAACQLGLLAYTAPSYSAAIQILSDINYANPAELSMIPKGQVLLGTGVGFLGVHFNGTSFGNAGRANRNMYDFLTYGQAAWRISPKIVIAMAVTQPVLADLNWGANNFTSSTSVDSLVKAVNFAPRFSYQVTPQLALGFGVDLEYDYAIHLDFQVPGAGVIRNHSSGLKPGFDFGAFYVINPKTFFSASFISQRQSNSGGTSASDSGLHSDHYSLYVANPLIVQAHLTRILTEKLLLSGGVYYSNWGVQRSFDLKNTVLGNVRFQNNWFDTWSFELGGKYDFTEKLSLLFGAMYETNFAPSSYNVIAFPGEGVATVAGGLKAQFDKHFSGQVLYVYKTSAPSAKFNSAANTGSLNFNLNIVAARLTYDF